MNLTRYVAVFCLATLAVILALWALFLLGVQVPGSGLSVVPVLCAALYEGQAYAKTHNAAPEKSAAWRFAGQATLVVLILQVLAMAALFVFMPDMAETVRFALRSSYVWGFAALLVFVLGMIFLSNRLFLSLGARNMLKARR